MSEEKRPSIFSEDNRLVWQAVRRLMLYLLFELERWYGFKANEKK